MPAVLWYFIGLNVLLGCLIPLLVIPLVVFTKVFVRSSKSKWGYECQEPENEEQCRLYQDAEA